VIHDYKYLGQRPRDKLLDDLVTGAALITAIVMALFYLLALVPTS
jgi:hypothetical protein